MSYMLKIDDLETTLYHDHADGVNVKLASHVALLHMKQLTNPYDHACADHVLLDLTTTLLNGDERIRRAFLKLERWYE